MSAKDAELAYKIAAYWRAVGYNVVPTLEGGNDPHGQHLTVIRSNMVNGLPWDWSHDTKSNIAIPCSGVTTKRRQFR